MRFVDFCRWRSPGKVPRCSPHPVFPSGLRTDARRKIRTPYSVSVPPLRSYQMPEKIFPIPKVRSVPPAHFSGYPEIYFLNCAHWHLVFLYIASALCFSSLPCLLLIILVKFRYYAFPSVPDTVPCYGQYTTNSPHVQTFVRFVFYHFSSAQTVFHKVKKTHKRPWR